ncbi:MAG: toll/interleukin-1 receptor domain-containing protein [Kiloniellales bacterium]|nr:toll/interleukin-1 receptor domain-containing protein [Kiloniellales bacterium]
MAKIFISHSSADTWVAKQIADHIRRCGAECFLDEADIDHGDDFESRILEAAQESSELLVLLTPWATNRPYVWLEMGVFWGSGKRIVAVLHGLSAKDLARDERAPIMLKRTDLVSLNEIDTYFEQLKARVEKG